MTRQYQVVQVIAYKSNGSYDFDPFHEKIAKLVSEGWKAQGGVAVQDSEPDIIICYQAMVKYEE